MMVELCLCFFEGTLGFLGNQQEHLPFWLTLEVPHLASRLEAPRLQGRRPTAAVAGEVAAEAGQSGGEAGCFLLQLASAFC